MIVWRAPYVSLSTIEVITLASNAVSDAQFARTQPSASLVTADYTSIIKEHAAHARRA